MATTVAKRIYHVGFPLGSITCSELIENIQHTHYTDNVIPVNNRPMGQNVHLRQPGPAFTRRFLKIFSTLFITMKVFIYFTTQLRPNRIMT